MEERVPSYTVGGNVNRCSLCGKQMEVPQKPKNWTTIWPRSFTPGYMSKKTKTNKQKTHEIKKDTCTPMFIAALRTVAKIWKQLKCPSTDKWRKKMWYIYTKEYYLAIKKEWNFAICSNMDGLMLSEISQRKTNTLWHHLYVKPKKWNKLIL